MAVTSTTTTTTSTKAPAVHPPMVLATQAAPQPASKYSSSYRPRVRKPENEATSTNTPTMNGRQMAGDSSKPVNQVNLVDPVSLKAAHDILKMMAGLPGPLAEDLPPHFLMSPKPSPTKTSFSDFAFGPKRPSPSGELVGLGLTLEPSSKRYKTDSRMYDNQEFSHVLAKMGSRKPAGASKAGWTATQWGHLQGSVNLRAIKSKRFADAYGRTPQAKQEYIDKTSPDFTLSVLHFTDSILLFLYSFWCSEQVSGRPRPSEYSSSDALRASVLFMWERAHRRDDISAEEKERTGCMVGLMHLIEAMVLNHLSHSQASTVQRQHKELSFATPNMSSSRSGPHAPSSSSNHPFNAQPSMMGQSPHSISPSDQDTPSSYSCDSNAVELANLANDLATINNKAATSLHNSRKFLTPFLMRNQFPRMFKNAMMSDFSTEAISAPGDLLGTGRTIDPDNTDHFAWPIELGMSAGIAHLCAFGRGMVREYAEKSGLESPLRQD